MIPGVETVHRREVWQPAAHPVRGPIQNPRAILNAVAHYPGCEHCTPFTLEAIPTWLHRMQLDWQLNRGYSLGYLWFVDWLGGAWECRGFDFKSAANLGRLVGGDANEYTAPIQFIVRGGEPATELAWATARKIWAEYARRAGRRDLGRPLSHHQLDPTACAGAGIRSQIVAGLGDPDRHPTPPTLEEDDDMRTTITRWAGEPYWIEVTPPRPGTTVREWRGITEEQGRALIAAGMAVDALAHPLPLALKGTTSSAPFPQYRRIG